jgi:hypothetical protein
MPIFHKVIKKTYKIITYKIITYIILMHPIAFYIKYLIEECYEEDYDPYYAENWLDNYCYTYTFVEWYFFYRRKTQFKCYKHTPTKLIIGSYVYNY